MLSGWLVFFKISLSVQVELNMYKKNMPENSGANVKKVCIRPHSCSNGELVNADSGTSTQVKVHLFANFDRSSLHYDASL